VAEATQALTPERTHGLSEDERRAWERDGFFVRRALFGEVEVERFRVAAEAMIVRTQRACEQSRDRYEIDGNEYVEARVGGRPATVQMEHREGSRTIRVVEPFHYLDPVFGPEREHTFANLLENIKAFSREDPAA